MSDGMDKRMVGAVSDWLNRLPFEREELLRALGDEYVESMERADHWIDREREFRLGRVDEVLLHAYLTDQLRMLDPGTVGDAAGIAAALVIRAAKG
ncbi:hypothetical protein [Micromonospora maritima]|uniref:hypothetical protein n=1 Tax=Micromonospora maritima TaxID=986711 RepID=UPI00157D0D02|nr:hypothetical protein [Micromonospora maritima]